MNCDFTSFFDGISVISGQWTDDCEWLCAMEPFIVEISPQVGLELGTARSVRQRLTHWATGAPAHL